MARIYYDGDGNKTGSSKSTTPGAIWGFICTVLFLCMLVGLFAH